MRILTKLFNYIAKKFDEPKGAATESDLTLGSNDKSKKQLLYVPSVIVIPNEHVRNVCRVGHGRVMCSFFMISGQGSECAKGTAEERGIVIRRLQGEMNAMGDNCSGPPGFIANKELVM